MRFHPPRERRMTLARRFNAGKRVPEMGGVARATVERAWGQASLTRRGSLLRVLTRR
jgi:hypothetical protein